MEILDQVKAYKKEVEAFEGGSKDSLEQFRIRFLGKNFSFRGCLIKIKGDCTE